MTDGVRHKFSLARVDPKSALASQRFAAQFEQDAPIFDFCHGCSSLDSAERRALLHSVTSLLKIWIKKRPAPGGGLGTYLFGTDFEPAEASHLDIFPQRSDPAGEQISDQDVWVFDEGLLQQTDLAVPFVQLAI